MKTKPLCFVMALLVAMTGCIKSTRTTDPVQFAEYVSGFTTGVISKTDPVRIKLATGNLKFETGKELPAGIISFEPSVAGTVSMYSEDLLIFKPSGEWPAGKTIKAFLRLDKLMDVPPQFSTFNFQFSIITPSFSIYPGNLVSIGQGQNKMKKMEGKLVSADIMKLEEVDKLLKARADGKRYKVKWAEGPGRNEFEFVIDSLPRNEQAYQLELEWNGSPLGIDQKGELAVTIPSIFDFIYLGYSIGQGEEQYLDIVLSDPVDPDQNLDGLVYLREGDPVRLVADNNIIRLYPMERLERSRTLIVEASVRNDIRTTLKERVVQMVNFEELKPQAEFIGQGVIMPDPAGLFLPVRAVSLRALDIVVYKIFENNIPYYLQENNFSDNHLYSLKQYGRPVYAKTLMLDEDKSIDLHRWNNFSLDLSPLMEKDMGAIYRVRISFRKEYSVYHCDNKTETDITEFILDGSVPDDQLEKYDQPGWYSDYEWPDDYEWEEQGNPCHDSYYIPERFGQKLIMASKIGVTAKSADTKQWIIHATDLISGEPLTDVSVGLYNFQNQPVGSATTGPEGQAEVTAESRPFFLKATKGKQTTWLRLDDGTSLSLSQFDISGAELQKGLKGMIYGERGIWRPGDTLFLTFILEDELKRIPGDYPVLMEVYNSRGQIVYSQTRSDPAGQFYIFKVATLPDAPTGNWRAVVKAGGATFEKSLKVETVKPNRLKIKLDFDKEILNAFSGNPVGTLEVKWLHGAVAPRVRTTVDMSFRKIRTGFRGYEKYTFDNPSGYFWWSEERNVLDQEMNDQGKGSFSLELPKENNAPGMMEAVFLVRAFEKGGDVSTDVLTKTFSPFKRYVGIKVPNGGTYDEMLETDEDQQIDIACVDWMGNPLTVRNLEVKVYRVDWRWWWSAGEDDLAYYVGGNDANLVYRGSADAVNGKGTFRFRIDYPDWGRYLILVKDNEGGHQAGKAVYIDWPSFRSRAGRANPAGATMLTFTADKERYEPGDKAVISFPASPGSRALVSVESGSRVLSAQWKICEKQEETIEIPVTKGMAPNVYVYLSLIRPHSQTLNDVPLRMYGVIPLMIEDPETVLSPVITMPGELRPEERFSVTISEKRNRPMTFTVAVVDEGLLDLTRFRTPDPHGVFYAREALGVKTWDMFDLVIGAFGARLERNLAIGGDEEAMLAKNKKAQRFVPVVRFAGPFTIGKGEKKEIHFTMPNYVGSVRTMVIAGHDGAYGMAEKATPVKKPLMVLATVPRVIGTTEEFEVPVSVFSMDEKIRDVTVTLESNDILTGLQNSVSLRFNQTGEQMAYFRLKATDREGIGKIKITAVSGSETASHSVEFDIRNPNPLLTRTESFMINPGEKMELPYEFFGSVGTNQGQVVFSGLPDFDLQKHLEYLIRYPYGCLEQTVSGAFPQLFLSDLMELSEDRKTSTDRNIRAAIQRISQMTLADGSLTYWPGEIYYDRWATSYAGHFLVLASEKGYLVPPGVLEKWKEFQYKAAGNYQPSPEDYYYWSNSNQAYRLYTLALAHKPNMSAMNRLRESGRLTPSATWILAAAYIYAGKPEVATDLITGKDPNVVDEYGNAGYTYGSELRDRAFTLEVLTLLKRDQEAFKVMNEIAKGLKFKYYSTQTTAFCLYAISRFAGAGATPGLSFEYRNENASVQTINTTKPVFSAPLDPGRGLKGTMTVSNKSTSARLFVSTTLSGQPLQGEEREGSSYLGIQVMYKDDAGKSLDVRSLKQGTDFVAEVTVSHSGVLFPYEELALTQIFPSGWEIINTRVQDVNPGIKEDLYDYRDYRDDRVYTFFDLQLYEKKTFRVRLNAAYTGRFYLPSVNAEAMYDDAIYAFTKGMWVEVVR